MEHPGSTLVKGRLVLPSGVAEGWVRTTGPSIVGVGADVGPAGGESPPGADVVETDGYVLPGLVDTHCHGALGSAYADGPEALARAAEHHHRCGTTSLFASTVSERAADLASQVAHLAGASARGVVDGVHLEGPYLSARRCGAHRPDVLRDPDLAEVADMLDRASGTLRSMTLAPELPGALALVRMLRDRDVTVAVGHTAASTSQTRAAIEAGARVATHLFNGMEPIHHRAGGPVVALLDDPRVRCELIADGEHLDADVVRWVWHSVGTERVMLVSDASPAVGMPDGELAWRGSTVYVASSRVRTASGALAGSAVTLLDAVRWVVGTGVPLVDAVAAASRVPAACYGLADRGSLAVGMRADLVLTDDDLRVRRVMRAGEWLDGPPTIGGPALVPGLPAPADRTRRRDSR